MENASKALLIAGGVLIAIIILTIGVTLYTLYSRQSEEYTEIISTTEIQKFNSKFDAYVGRTDITAQEIVSLVNLAKEYNDIVTIKLGSSILKFDTITPEQFIKQNLDETFSCQNPVYDSETGKITRDKIYKE